jgi:hypothetical protein
MGCCTSAPEDEPRQSARRENSGPQIGSTQPVAAPPAPAESATTTAPPVQAPAVAAEVAAPPAMAGAVAVARESAGSPVPNEPGGMPRAQTSTTSAGSVAAGGGSGHEPAAGDGGGGSPVGGQTSPSGELHSSAMSGSVTSVDTVAVGRQPGASTAASVASTRASPPQPDERVQPDADAAKTDAAALPADQIAPPTLPSAALKPPPQQQIAPDMRAASDSFVGARPPVVRNDDSNSRGRVSAHPLIGAADASASNFHGLRPSSLSPPPTQGGASTSSSVVEITTPPEGSGFYAPPPLAQSAAGAGEPTGTPVLAVDSDFPNCIPSRNATEDARSAPTSSLRAMGRRGPPAAAAPAVAAEPGEEPRHIEQDVVGVQQTTNQAAPADESALKDANDPKSQTDASDNSVCASDRLDDDDPENGDNKE